MVYKRIAGNPGVPLQLTQLLRESLSRMNEQLSRLIGHELHASWYEETGA